MKIHTPIAIDSVASVPWKNGGGTTQQLAVSPEGATTNDFLWRISIAQIDSPGEFSVFPGIDRTIVFWGGDGVTLRSSAWPDHRLDDPRSPFFLRGEEEVVCDLLGGATQDLNLMVRRGQVDATFEAVSKHQYTVPECNHFILLCASGSARVVPSSREHSVDIMANQFLRISNLSPGEAMVVAEDNTLFIAIAIRVVG